LKDRTLALGSKDSGHAAILPGPFSRAEGLHEGRDYRTLRFNSDLGKHGDTGASEVEVVRAVLNGQADAGRDRQSFLGEGPKGTPRTRRRS
jgi:ABC-type phosphate/phosphonate transport system substrate-binding protein